MIDAETIRRLQDEWTERWHQGIGPQAGCDEFAGLVRENHRANFELWHEEDSARDPSAPDAVIAGVKRAIDRLNQRRNDVVEQIDEWSLRAAPTQIESAPLHSETPGMMIDRMSILALKIFHMREQALRADATDEHRQTSGGRLSLLQEQRSDLAMNLAMLWTEVLEGRRRFKVYRQLKMYNDPEMNPVLYRSRT